MSWSSKVSLYECKKRYTPRCPYCEIIVNSFNYHTHYSCCKSASFPVRYFCSRYEIDPATEHLKNSLLRSIWLEFIEQTLRGPKPPVNNK
jgi:hypothetical protein